MSRDSTCESPQLDGLGGVVKPKTVSANATIGTFHLGSFDDMDSIDSHMIICWVTGELGAPVEMQQTVAHQSRPFPVASLFLSGPFAISSGFYCSLGQICEPLGEIKSFRCLKFHNYISFWNQQIVQHFFTVLEVSFGGWKSPRKKSVRCYRLIAF